LADHNIVDYPILCFIRVFGSMAGSRANPHIGVVTLRRFPLPWTIQELDACFVSAGQKLANPAAKKEAARFGGLQAD
jgi:hypothetical protein